VLAELADPGYVLALLRAPLAPWLLGGAAICQLVACLLINRIARVGEGW
jgi:Flp pilus assembly protein TadB